MVEDKEMMICKEIIIFKYNQSFNLFYLAWKADHNIKSFFDFMISFCGKILLFLRNSIIIQNGVYFECIGVQGSLVINVTLQSMIFYYINLHKEHQGE